MSVRSGVLSASKDGAGWDRCVVGVPACLIPSTPPSYLPHDGLNYVSHSYGAVEQQLVDSMAT